MLVLLGPAFFCKLSPCYSSFTLHLQVGLAVLQNAPWCLRTFAHTVSTTLPLILCHREVYLSFLSQLKYYSRSGLHPLPNLICLRDAQNTGPLPLKPLIISHSSFVITPTLPNNFQQSVIVAEVTSLFPVASEAPSLEFRERAVR